MPCEVSGWTWKFRSSVDKPSPRTRYMHPETRASSEGREPADPRRGDGNQDSVGCQGYTR